VSIRRVTKAELLGQKHGVIGDAPSGGHIEDARRDLGRHRVVGRDTDSASIYPHGVSELKGHAGIGNRKQQAVPKNERRRGLAFFHHNN